MSGTTILVVDDEPQIRRTLRTALTNIGYMVVEARNGQQALWSLREERPELVLLDVNMPGLGGGQACREIRERSDVAIIMLTVRDTERDKIQALDAGADDYVVKPFSMDELISRIRRIHAQGSYRITGVTFDVVPAVVSERADPIRARHSRWKT